MTIVCLILSEHFQGVSSRMILWMNEMLKAILSRKNIICLFDLHTSMLFHLCSLPSFKWKQNEKGGKRRFLLFSSSSFFYDETNTPNRQKLYKI